MSDRLFAARLGTLLSATTSVFLFAGLAAAEVLPVTVQPPVAAVTTTTTPQDTTAAQPTTTGDATAESTPAAAGQPSVTGDAAVQGTPTVATSPASAAETACFQGPAKLSDADIQAFLNAPADLLNQFPSGGMQLSTRVRSLSGSSAATLDPIVELVKSASSMQVSAIGSGLARAARACVASNEEYAATIQEKVASIGNAEFNVAFETALNEVQTAALGAGAGAGGGAAGIGGGAAGIGGGAAAGGGTNGTAGANSSTSTTSGDFSFNGGGQAFSDTTTDVSVAQ